MPQGIEVFVEEGFAEITVPDKTLRGQVLNSILAHTPVALIEKDTRKGKHVVYRIPEGNARDAGLLDESAVEGRLPIKGDMGLAQDLVDADPQVSGRGGQHGEYRTPMPHLPDTFYAGVPTVDGPVGNSDLQFTEPQPNNGAIRGPLRPNKPAPVHGTSVPEGASILTADLQARIRENTPNPVDYAPTRVPREELVPHAQATIAATVDRAPQGPAKPASGIGIGPNAGRVVEGQPGGEAGTTTVSAPDIIAEQRDVEGKGGPDAQTTSNEPVPTADWTVADLRDYAKNHNIDLEGATKKADILVKIRG